MPAVRLPSARRHPADNAPKAHHRRAGGGFYYPDTAKTLNGAQGLPRAFYGGEGKIHEKNPKIQKTNQTKSQKTQKPRPFLRARQKNTQRKPLPRTEQNRTEPNRTEPVITTTNSGGRLPATTSATTPAADDVLPATPAESAPAAAPATTALVPP